MVQRTCSENIMGLPGRGIYYCRNQKCEQSIDTVASFSDLLLPIFSTNILFILLSIQLLSSMWKRSNNPCADFKSEISYTQFINENVSMFDNQKQIGQKRPYRSLQINIFLSFSSYLYFKTDEKFLLFHSTSIPLHFTLQQK